MEGGDGGVSDVTTRKVPYNKASIQGKITTYYLSTTILNNRRNKLSHRLLVYEK